MNGKFRTPKATKREKKKFAWFQGSLVHSNHLRQVIISPLAASYLPMKNLCVYIYQLGPIEVLIIRKEKK